MMKENTTSAKNWLKMDLEGQSGAIWTDEKSEFQNEKTILPLFSDEDEPEEKWETSPLITSELEDLEFLKMLETSKLNSFGIILKPNPVYYNGREIKDDFQIID